MSNPQKSYLGTVTDFGAAPYQHNENNSPSYFVQLQMDNGQNRTIWAMGLREHIENLNIQKGEAVNLLDMGTQNGSKRHIWEVERHEPYQGLQNIIEQDVEREQEKSQPQSNKTAEIVRPLSDFDTELPSNIKNNYIAITKNRLLQDEKINYYDKNDKDQVNIAFEDRSKSLHTSRQDDKTIHAMLDLAESKNWTAIKLKGTEEFKQKAWLEASLRGIETKGYTPSEKDKAELQVKQQARTTNQVEATAIKPPPIIETDKPIEPIARPQVNEQSTQTATQAQQSEQGKYAQPNPSLSSITINWTEKHGEVNQTFSNFEQVQTWYKQEFSPEYIANNPNIYDKSQITVHYDNVPDDLTKHNYQPAVGVDYFNPHRDDLKQSYIDEYQEDYEHFGIDLEEMINHWGGHEQSQPVQSNEYNEQAELGQSITTDSGRYELNNIDYDNFGEREKLLSATHIYDNETGEHYVIGTFEVDYMGEKSNDVFADMFQNDTDFINRHDMAMDQEQVFAKLGISKETKEITTFISGDIELSNKQVELVLNKDNLRQIIKDIPDLRPEMKIAYEAAKEAGFDKSELNEYVNEMLRQQNVVWERNDRNDHLKTVAQVVSNTDVSIDKYNAFADKFSQLTKMDFSYMKIETTPQSNKELSQDEQFLKQHFSNIGEYSLNQNQLNAIENWRKYVVEAYQSDPDFVARKMNDLNNKIPDIASGKFELPPVPDNQIMPAVEIPSIHQGNQERTR